jgi:fatty acid desaturase (delta-4 desaturase)
MAPDADKLRLRKAQLADEKKEVDATTQRIVTLKSLTGTEVCIDGGIYDIADFDHPGGEQILLFGGNDVTVQYKMIHPHHTSKHLEKMKRVGTVTDYECEYVIRTQEPRHFTPRFFLTSLISLAQIQI